jgi:hypothetical protein
LGQLSAGQTVHVAAVDSAIYYHQKKNPIGLYCRLHFRPTSWSCGKNLAYQLCELILLLAKIFFFIQQALNIEGKSMRIARL